MAQEQCRLTPCELPGTLRGGFCTEAHRDERKRAGWRLRKKRLREREADSIPDGVVAASDGRSRPGAGADAHTPPTDYHPTKRFGRRLEPDVVDLAVPGTTDRGCQTNRVLQRQHVQRYTPPQVEQENWLAAATTTASPTSTTLSSPTTGRPRSTGVVGRARWYTPSVLHPAGEMSDRRPEPGTGAYESYVRRGTRELESWGKVLWPHVSARPNCVMRRTGL